MWNITNLPTKRSDVEILCKIAPGGNYCLQTSEGWIICMIDSGGAPNDVTARDIADLARMARDSGFEQGLASVREAIGVKL